MKHQVRITINVVIPHIDFSYDLQNQFVSAVAALFRGMFPRAEELPKGDDYIPPFTITVDMVEVKEDAPRR